MFHVKLFPVFQPLRGLRWVILGQNVFHVKPSINFSLIKCVSRETLGAKIEIWREMCAEQREYIRKKKDLAVKQGLNEEEISGGQKMNWAI